ncbi:MAG: Holliday junction branch migration protein RuvA [Bacteroidales bacterium]|nr:MAG: Holliday junction branch migration protein RuvA [Bacteroidales bacterium]
MFDFIKGNLVDLKPTYAVIETANIGYFIHISLNTYSQLSREPGSRLYIHQVIREDSHLLYGFFDVHEREIFRMLISVSGIGANTARMILSSLSPSEIEQAIFEGNVALLKGIKGIGTKTAQRLIVDLKDKVGKSAEAVEIFAVESNTLKEESLSALVMLGFPKTSVQKVLDQILQQEKELSVEEVIKKALKKL